jgi:hypothetical protein
VIGPGRREVPSACLAVAETSSVRSRFRVDDSRAARRLTASGRVAQDMRAREKRGSTAKSLTGPRARTARGAPFARRAIRKASCWAGAVHQGDVLERPARPTAAVKSTRSADLRAR